jgi:hypothetical protein
MAMVAEAEAAISWTNVVSAALGASGSLLQAAAANTMAMDSNTVMVRRT